MSKLRLFSTYTGYGGAEWGLMKANIDFEVVGYSEIHKGQIKIYEQNFKGHKNYGDITKVDPKDVPDCDMITGGFPCQDVSMAGLRDLSIGRTRTVFHLLKIIEVKKPKYVLLENVEGILSMLEGELIKEIVRYLKRIGYAVSYKLLYSKEHGTPQNRPRVFIAAELDRDSFLFNPFPQKEELKLKVSDLLEDNVDDNFYLTLKQIERVIRRSELRGKPLGIRINPDVATTRTTKDPKHNPADEIFISSDMCNTITSGDYSHLAVQNMFFLESKGIRVLTPRECFRLQGFFNDEINIDDIPKTTAYFSAGNGWDINLVSKIFAKWLKETSYNKDYTNKENKK